MSYVVVLEVTLMPTSDKRTIKSEMISETVLIIDATQSDTERLHAVKLMSAASCNQQHSPVSAGSSIFDTESRYMCALLERQRWSRVEARG
jgi:hypothetical protein